jgi:scyllo-inosamine 4-kinase
MIERIRAIAAAIYAEYGVDFATTQRAGGWTNAVWLADDLALRMSMTKQRESLLREARLSALFPSAVGYPAVLATGMTDEIAWSLASRLQGTSLEEAWAGLHWEERVIALRGVWARAQAVHAVPVTEAAVIVSRQAWFNNSDAQTAEASLIRLSAAGILSAAECRVLHDVLNGFWNALPDAPCVLCHGDLTLGNVLWHGGQTVALLDFEFALIAPVQLDLNHLVKCAFGPEDVALPLSTDDRQGILQLRRAVLELAQPLLVQPRSHDLLRGYAILLELWLLELWLANPEGEGPLEQWEPLRRLRSLADGAGGYLAPLLHRTN